MVFESMSSEWKFVGHRSSNADEVGVIRVVLCLVVAYERLYKRSKLNLLCTFNENINVCVTDNNQFKRAGVYILQT